MRGPASQRIRLPAAHLLPNFVTVAAICAGLSAIRFAFEDNLEVAVQLILVACVLDGLDGRLARMLNGESAFGAELDSLADFLNFGVAPALLVYLWGFQEMRNAGWIAVILYVLCCVMRLARFNIGMKSEDQTPQPAHFVGVPAPAGALLVMLPIFVSFMWSDSLVIWPELVALHMVGIGLLMISRLPTWSMKRVAIRREHVRFVLIGFVVLVAILLSYPWATLVVFDLVYLAGIVWFWRAHRQTPPKGPDPDGTEGR